MLGGQRNEPIGAENEDRTNFFVGNGETREFELWHLPKRKNEAKMRRTVTNLANKKFSHINSTGKAKMVSARDIQTFKIEFFSKKKVQEK